MAHRKRENGRDVRIRTETKKASRLSSLVATNRMLFRSFNPFFHTIGSGVEAGRVSEPFSGNRVQFMGESGGNEVQ